MVDPLTSGNVALTLLCRVFNSGIGLLTLAAVPGSRLGRLMPFDSRFMIWRHEQQVVSLSYPKPRLKPCATKLSSF